MSLQEIYYPPPVDDEPVDVVSSTTTPPKQKKDRFTIINRFCDVTMIAKKLTTIEGMVWVILWRDTSNKTGIARTARSYLASRAGCSEAAVKRALKKLEDEGLLTTVHKGGHNRGLSLYRVHAE